MSHSQDQKATGTEDQDRCSGLLILAIAAGMILWSLKLPVGTINSPGPGLFPLILAVLLAVLSAGLIFEQVRGGFNTGFVADVVREEGARVAVFCVLYFAHVLTFERVGFILSTGVFLVFVYVLILRKGIVTATAYAVFVTVPIYLIFDRLLSVSLPAGLLG